LKALLEGFEGVSTTELSDALAASEQSMKQWVNEQLAGYATIADVDAQIATLKATITEESEAERQEIEALIAELKTLQEATEASYKEAIASAIQNQGVINEQVAADIAAVNKRIDEALATINSRLDEIEARLDKIEEAIKDLVNRIQSVSLIKSGSDAVKIVTSAESASVTLNYEISPKSAVEGLALKWEEYVKVKALYDGEELVFVDMPITSFSANAEHGIVTVTVSGENLSAEFYTDLKDASLRMEISDGNNDKRSEYTPIVPKRWFSKGISLVPANDELYYITTDGNTLVPTNANNKTDTELFGANIVSNLYDWQKGCFVFKFDGEVTTIGNYAFGIKQTTDGTYHSTLKYFAMPNSVTDIAAQAFAYCCDELVSIIIPDSVTAIGRTAFAELAKLESVKLGQNVKSLGLYSFSRCTNLKSINIPNKITTIPDYCFRGCEKLKDIVLHDNIQSIGNHAFESCKAMKISVLPANLTTMGKWAFGDCEAITSITLPDNTPKLFSNASISFELTKILLFNSFSAFCALLISLDRFSSNLVILSSALSTSLIIVCT
jgi:prefoldin subunit 5